MRKGRIKYELLDTFQDYFPFTCSYQKIKFIDYKTLSDFDGLEITYEIKFNNSSKYKRKKDKDAKESNVGPMVSKA